MVITSLYNTLCLGKKVIWSVYFYLTFLFNLKKNVTELMCYSLNYCSSEDDYASPCEDMDEPYNFSL